MLVLGIKHHLDKVPEPVKLFAKRALLLLAAWILIYHIVLKPLRVPDRWLSASTASASARFLSIWFAPVTSIEKDGWSCVMIGSRSVIRIGDPCNALDLMALYAGFLICLPTTTRRMLLFTCGGFCIIFVLNVLRCSALSWLSLNNHEWVDFAHKYAFTAIVYCFIFYGWILYTKKYNIKKNIE